MCHSHLPVFDQPVLNPADGVTFCLVQSTWTESLAGGQQWKADAAIKMVPAERT